MYEEAGSREDKTAKETKLTARA